jgi:hypothetical protein
MNPFMFGNPASIGQQTAANRLITAYAPGNGATTRGPRRKRRKVARATARKTAKRRASKARPARLVKGSAAARAYMAKIRRKRRK